MDLSGKESVRVTVIGMIINLLMVALKGATGILANYRWTSSHCVKRDKS